MVHPDFTKESFTAILKNKYGKLVIADKQAKVVRDIFRWYLDGASVLGIIKKLSEAGIPSPTGKGKWSKRTIDVMLGNEKYTGNVRLLDNGKNDVCYLAENNNPAIIFQGNISSSAD